MIMLTRRAVHMLMLSCSLVLATNSHPQDAVQVPEECQAAYHAAKSLREDGQKQVAVNQFAQLAQKCPDNFYLLLEYGRTLAMLERFADAAKVLDQAIVIKENSSSPPDATVYNVRGYVSIMQNQYEEALGYFKKGLNDSSYEALPKNTQMKLNNNAGFVLFSLERYDEARGFLQAAEALGSTLATENLQKVNSVVQSLEAQDPDIPGIFAPVVGSEKLQSEIPRELDRLATKLEVERAELRVFKQGNGWYAIALGSNYSYIKAKEIAAHARIEGIKDAYVASTVTWESLDLVTTPRGNKPN